jgi:hypothetical protein
MSNTWSASNDTIRRSSSYCPVRILLVAADGQWANDIRVASTSRMALALQCVFSSDGFSRNWLRSGSCV